MNIGDTYLITTDNWFYAPDGQTYRSVFGTVHAVVDSEAVLGIRTNARSTNWYVAIGDMVVAGCQIHYAVRSTTFQAVPPVADLDHEGQRFAVTGSLCHVYDADRSGMKAFVAAGSSA